MTEIEQSSPNKREDRTKSVQINKTLYRPPYFKINEVFDTL